MSLIILVFSTQDLSYYCCIELQGEEDELLAALSQLTSKDAGEKTTSRRNYTLS